MNKKLLVHIEIPSNSKIKYEYSRELKKMLVDRVLVGDFAYPVNYGYVAEALDYDGDELDVLVYSPHTFLPGVALHGRLVGSMEMIDDGETDTKLIVVHADDKALDHIQHLNDIPKEWINKVQTFFSTYKNYKRVGITKINGFHDEKHATAEYEACVKLMQEYGQLSKKDFIAKMKREHPEKYPK